MSTGTRFAMRALLTSSFLFTPFLQAQEEAAKAETFAEIEKEYEQAHDEWMSTYRAALKRKATGDEVQKIIASQPKGSAYSGRVIRVMQARPQSDEGAAAAIWMVRIARVKGAELGKSLDVLREHHIDNDLRDVMLSLSRSPLPAAGLFLEHVVSGSKSLENRARACFALGEHHKGQASMIRRLETADEAALGRYTESYGKEALDVLRAMDPVAAEALGARCFEKILATEEYAAVEGYGNTLGESATSDLYELRNLAIGKVAPDIVGEDIDGTPMKLSDYRGKVVVIDFWGDW